MKENLTSVPDALAQTRTLATEFAKTYPLRDRRNEFPAEEMATLKASGLLALPVPTEYGGLGAACPDIVRTVMTLATGNPSVAQMFAVHCILGTVFVRDFATETQKQRLFADIVKKNVFLGNASAERQAKHLYAFETTFMPTPANDGVRINGRKFFSTGARASEMLLIIGMLNNNIAAAFVPHDADGLIIRHDWDSMGQRGTASGTTDLHDVFAPWEMVIPRFVEVGYDKGGVDPNSFFGPIFQTCLASIFVGAAKGALHQAIQYVKTKTRPLPWPGSGVTTAVEDHYILQEVGKMSAHLLAAERLIDAAAEGVDRTLGMRGKLEREELMRRRAEASVTVSHAKVVATEVALRVCQDIFQVCGARSAMAEEDLDRFWRDVRTLTLHDPVAYQARAIGEYLLQGKLPVPGFRH
jgi:alkylation response protein AidB-like acyl-CoA dehydrogenase